MGTFDQDVPVTCRMSTIRLSSLDPEDLGKPSYRCLSYVWGNPEFHEILVNRKRIYISKNLCIFLQRMRGGSAMREERHQYLWIDAICIDQHNVEERNQQVQMMGTIYQSARQVIVWLGREWDRLGNASEQARNFQAQPQTPPLDEQGNPIERALPTESIAVLLDRVWFRRVWVVQEAALAKQLVVVCG
ncbi:HET-domain-containing protein, partial [Polychaeton citri CBS 116435]